MAISNLRTGVTDAALARPRTLRIPFASIGQVAAALLCSCAGPTLSAEPPTRSSAAILSRASNICDGTMGFDVSGPYFISCRNYVIRNGREGEAVGISPSDPTTHRACKQAGLADGTLEFDRCVQAMGQLDVSSVHL